MQIINILNNIAITLQQQNNSYIIKNPIIIDNMQYNIYYLDLTKSLLQIILYIINNINTYENILLEYNSKQDNTKKIKNLLEKKDIIKNMLSDITINNDNKTYKDFIIKYAQYFNNDIKIILTYYLDKLDNTYYKFLTIDDIIMLSKYDIYNLLKKLKFDIKIPFTIRIYKINSITPGYIDNELFVL